MVILVRLSETAPLKNACRVHLGIGCFSLYWYFGPFRAPTLPGQLIGEISPTSAADFARISSCSEYWRDAIQEFSVITNEYNATYGGASGGVVNAVSRSGTNVVHGDAYEFLRNDVLDARNFFDGAKPPFRRNQFGAAIGGPIRRDKTFFFMNYEGLQQRLTGTSIATVPSATARAGDLSSGKVNSPGKRASTDILRACSPRNSRTPPTRYSSIVTSTVGLRISMWAASR
jgi:hypothetical protein